MNSFGLNANLILDPTLMLTSNEWKEISSKRKVLDEPYILVYQLHENPEFDLYLKKLAEKTRNMRLCVLDTVIQIEKSGKVHNASICARFFKIVL
ncbi:MAG: hypothetical protein ACLU6Y_14615 [Ruminococcus sp.]